MQQANSGQAVIGLAHTDLHGCGDKRGWNELRYVQAEKRGEIQSTHIIDVSGCCHVVMGLEIQLNCSSKHQWLTSLSIVA